MYCDVLGSIILYQIKQGQCEKITFRTVLVCTISKSKKESYDEKNNIDGNCYLYANYNGTYNGNKH